MLIHRPYGVGHPYAATPDQRHPVLPEVGQTCRVGVLVADGAEVTGLRCEWVERTPQGAEIRHRVQLAPVHDAQAAAALAGGEGHLADAQAAALSSGPAWQCRSPVLRAGHRYRYRFVADQACTSWYDVCPADWVPAVDRCAIQVDPARLVPDSVRWLSGPDGVHRVRFALRLAAGAHVVGFGERFDRLDQAGHALDCVVFEQYKGQGRAGRTYFPNAVRARRRTGRVVVGVPRAHLSTGLVRCGGG